MTARITKKDADTYELQIKEFVWERIEDGLWLSLNEVFPDFDSIDEIIEFCLELD